MAKLVGFPDADMACSVAEVRGEAGLTGSGQQCGPISWHAWDGREVWGYLTWDSRLVVPGQTLSQDEFERFLRSLGS